MGRSSLTSPPSAREISVLAALLLFLLVSCFYDSADSQSHYLTTQRPSSANTAAVAPHQFDTQLSWHKTVPQTSIVAHVPGWTIFDRLYFLNGTLYVVSDEPDSVPSRRMMISTAVHIANGPIEEAKRIPTDKEMSIISSATAKELFGTSAERMDGVTVSISVRHYAHADHSQFFVNDPSQL